MKWVQCSLTRFNMKHNGKRGIYLDIELPDLHEERPDAVVVLGFM